MYQLRLHGVTVEFKVYDQRDRSLRDRVLLNPVRRVASTAHAVGGQLTVDRFGHAVVRALDSIDLALSDGDRLGLLGHNGSGKTTMLRVMAGIYEPVAGEVVAKGRITPLFGVGQGLDMEATGYEAIRLRGLMVGRSHKDVEATVEEIAQFTELGGYLTMPLRTYSSGMLVRLAFAVATSVPPEILLMDEMIGAGDAAFVERAQARLMSFVQSSGIMVVATHSDNILRKWCNKAILLEKGRAIAQGDVDSVIDARNRAMLG
jgi:homopolymeric O-antigen transport system ATP-binding protein